MYKQVTNLYMKYNDDPMTLYNKLSNVSHWHLVIIWNPS